MYGDLSGPCDRSLSGDLRERCKTLDVGVEFSSALFREACPQGPVECSEEEGFQSGRADPQTRCGTTFLLGLFIRLGKKGIQHVAQLCHLMGETHTLLLRSIGWDLPLNLLSFKINKATKTFSYKIHEQSRA